MSNLLTPQIETLKLKNAASGIFPSEKGAIGLSLNNEDQAQKLARLRVLAQEGVTALEEGRSGPLDVVEIFRLGDEIQAKKKA